MYENIAWNSFEKTGSLESFLEYRKLAELKDYILNRKKYKLEGALNEFGKIEGDSDKGSSI
jgi:hypothetical protein